MNGIHVIRDGFSRIDQLVPEALTDLHEDELLVRPDEDSNSIAWLIWHLTRVQDAQIADLTESEQVWTSMNWYTLFDLPYDADATGYGQSSTEVGSFTVANTELLLGYFNDTSQTTRTFLESRNDADLDSIVDTRWDPPVTMNVRLVSIISDDIQHAGQAAYLRGMMLRARRTAPYCT